MQYGLCYYIVAQACLTTFYTTLENLLSESHITDIVLGDFNIDIMDSTNIKLQHLLFYYTLLVNEATDTLASLVDHGSCICK